VVSILRHDAVINMTGRCAIIAESVTVVESVTIVESITVVESVTVLD
jgi:hypothetical protein